jgi:hypothetical protein
MKRRRPPLALQLAGLPVALLALAEFIPDSYGLRPYRLELRLAATVGAFAMAGAYLFWMHEQEMAERPASQENKVETPKWPPR